MTTETTHNDRPSSTSGAGGPLGWITGPLTCVPLWVVALFARVGLAGVFFRSGQSKVAGWEITPATYFLFQEEYKVPLLPPDLAAQTATLAEHVFPVLLVLGLATRLSALGLLGMTVVIQIFVYPNSWPDHALWATAALLLVLRGAGPVSLDHLLGRQLARRG
ncbi:DoxX family protein [Roseospira visakhapatnamensis]|uniref:Putative oxidoreductase n=1 Tax=Roseospira visakhapatnamensis TaxID=390880 RepID=A0A7W6WAG4_9PROT|nr:DoxX family protein [Roseospira visakhapatnamensis]MBB4266466.1 putative oxidoreductase [Roseospira visakhapatnamensis]